MIRLNIALGYFLLFHLGLFIFSLTVLAYWAISSVFYGIAAWVIIVDIVSDNIPPELKGKTFV